ncbi:MAG: hypothetical protein WDM70_07600 [Nitrosomonadales bacterium]
MFNSQKSKLCIVLVVLGAVFCSAQVMAFGLGDITGGGKSSSASSGDPDAFLKTAQAAEVLMGSSLTHLSNSLLAKGKSADFAAQRKAANETTDPKEKEARIAEIQKSEAAAVQAAVSDSNLKENINKMDSSQRAEIGAAAFNFVLALLQDKALSEQASGLISSLSSNPMNIGKLGSVKDAASSVSNQMSSGAQLATKMPAIFSAVGVTAPTSMNDKPKADNATNGTE